MQDERDFFRDVTVHITGRLHLDRALHDLFVYMRQYIPCCMMEMNYFDHNTGEMRTLAQVEEQGGEIITKKSHTLFVLPAEATEILIRDFDHNRFSTIRIIDPNDHHDHPPHPKFKEAFKRLEKYQNLLFAGLSIEKLPMGVLVCGCRPPERFEEKHAQMLESVREPLAIAFSNARRYEELLRMKNRLDEDNRALNQELAELAGTTVIGMDGGLREVMDLVRQVAPLSSPVMLLGETGTGKEVLAHAIHALSPRGSAPFVRVQCGAIPDTLLDSELFGHEKGAFTGAIIAKRGRFERAHEGTIFLDEIGELTQEAQVKLLRVLQEKEFERLGGSETIKVDVRVIAATHRNLEEMVKAGTFREDLWFRLNVFPMMIPPLRQREEDISSLLVYFVQRKCRDLSLMEPPPPDAETLEMLKTYDWPGNVRELQNVVERALITSAGGPMNFQDLLTIGPGCPSRTKREQWTG